MSADQGLEKSGGTSHGERELNIKSQVSIKFIKIQKKKAKFNELPTASKMCHLLDKIRVTQDIVGCRRTM